MTKGSLFLIPNLLGDSEVSPVVPKEVQERATNLRYFIVENIKIARRYLRKIDREFPIDDSTFFELNKHTNLSDISKFLDPLFNGSNIGIISDAGCPGIADPGADIIKIAHQKDIEVVPLVGPSSILLALISSGMNGQNFSFHGYLPKDKADRIKTIKSIEQKSIYGTQIFMDTPFRNMSLLDDILETCNNETLVCIACDITLENEFIKTKPISYWKANLPKLNKRPCLFLISK